MGCIDPEKLNLPILDINRPISIPFRSPYTLELTQSAACPENNIVLYKEAKDNNYRMGGIILNENNTIICNVKDNIFCDILQASYIVIQSSELGIGGGEYISAFIDSSTLNASSITADVVLCYNSKINNCSFNLGATIDIMNGSVSIKNSSISSDNFLTIMAEGRQSTIIDDSSILINYYMLADKINASRSVFNSNISVVYDSKFKDCKLRLNGEYNANEPKYLQPGGSSSVSFDQHKISLTKYFTIIGCTLYKTDDQGLIIGCARREAVDSPGLEKLDKSISSREEQLEELEGVPASDSPYKQSAELLDGATQMFEWLATESYNSPFAFSSVGADGVGVNERFQVTNILKKCEFDNTEVFSSEPLILDQCIIKNSNLLINASEIVSREISLSPGAGNQPTHIRYHDRTTIAYIGNSTYDPENPDNPITSLTEGSHIIADRWFGEVSIGDDCSITCNDFFAEYCEMSRNSKLTLNSEHTMLENLGLTVLPTEAILEIKGTLYAGPNKNGIIPEINGVISGSALSIVAQGAKDIFAGAWVTSDSLDVRGNEITIGSVVCESLTVSADLTIGTLYPKDSDTPINIKAEPASILTINNGPTGVVLNATGASVSLGAGTIGVNGEFNDSELKAGTLLNCSLSGTIRNFGEIAYPTMEDHIIYFGRSTSLLGGVDFPDADDTNRSQINFIAGALISDCVIPTGNIVRADHLTIIGEKSDIGSIDADEVTISSYSTILSYGNIEKLNFHDSAKGLSLLELNNMNIDIDRSPLIINEQIAKDTIGDFVINHTKVALGVGGHNFTNLNLLERSLLDGQSLGDSSNCSSIFSVDRSRVDNLNINLNSINTNFAVFYNSTLKFAPEGAYTCSMQNTAFERSDIDAHNPPVDLIMNDCIFDGSRILSSSLRISGGTISLQWQSENQANIVCETLIMIHSKNFGTIKCKNLIWRSSENAGSVVYENAIEVDNSFLSGNS